MAIAIEEVTFSSRNLKIVALLHHPSPDAPNRSGAAIVIAHPWTSIKEQAPANYAKVLSQAGFICLTYDAAHYGESEGEPRNLEDPAQRVEDIKSAVTYLVGRKDIDSNRIGALGICASGGYVPFATQTDLRIKACATSAAVCVGTMARRGFDKDSSSLDILKAQLEAAAKDRNSDVGGEAAPIVHLLPPSEEEMPPSYPDSFKDLFNYYRKRAPYPGVDNSALPRSWDLMGNFDAFAYNAMISPRPLLMITGTKAATKWYSEDAIAKAKEPKELFVVDGVTHADLYDHVDVAGPKLIEFFANYLA